MKKYTEIVSYGYDKKRFKNGNSGFYISYKVGTRIISKDFKTEKEYIEELNKGGIA